MCAELCDQSTTESYSKAGKIIANKIGKRINNNINIKELYLYQLINPPQSKEINQLKINANKIIFPTDTKINKYLNNFYNTGLDPFDYIQKETSIL